jgi:iron complex transport system substrate-binding protein
MRTGPRRIVCLSAETTETLYLLGEAERIVGISAFATRPERARHDKPIVGGFSRISLERVLALTPDLVLGFSDLQAELAADLIRAGIAVHVFNQRSIAQILESIRLLGAMVQAAERAERLIASLEAGLEAARAAAARQLWRPRVYFEEWDEPLITGIQWVSELIEIAGGQDCFAELARAPLAHERIIAEAGEVVRRAPDLILVSWCGKRFHRERVCARPGWAQVPAIERQQVHEIPSSDILSPGPAALGAGLQSLQRLIGACADELSRAAGSSARAARLT